MNRTVEYLVALDDQRWDTVLVDSVPESIADDDRAGLVAWAEANLAPQAQYRNVVLWQLYCVMND